MNKRKSKTERATHGKVAVSPTQAMIEPQPTSSIPSPDAIPPMNAPSPSANGDEEAALARLADDGGPPPPQAELEAQTGETPVPPQDETGETLVPPRLSPNDLPPAASALTLSLEERVRRLEEALTLLQEQRAVETRAVPTPAPTRPPDPPPVAKVAPLPAVPAAAASPASTAVLLDVGKRLLGAAAQVVPSALPPVPNVAHPAGRSGALWLLWDTWAEARAILRMFVDPRYHLPWSARVLPLVVLAAILTSKYWVPGSSIPVLGDWLLVKLIDLLLAFLLFKWLGHEARRYRQTSPDLPSSLRL